MTNDNNSFMPDATGGGIFDKAMKKLFLLFILILISAASFAQSLKCTAAYVYDKAQAVDADGNVIETFNNVSGTVFFYEKGNQKAIASTIGDQTMYVLEVISKKTYTDSNVYLGYMWYEGGKVMIEVFEVFDLDKSKVVPDYFLFFVRDNITGERVNGQACLNISRKQ